MKEQTIATLDAIIMLKILRKITLSKGFENDGQYTCEAVLLASHDTTIPF